MTKNKTDKTIKLNHIARESAEIYADVVLEACRKAKVEPIDALIDTDDYPKLLKHPMVEFAIGWLTGCAEAHAVTLEALWNQVGPKTARKAA
jgi:hypothetical protein